MSKRLAETAPSRLRIGLNRFFLVLFGLLLALIVLEITLRVWTNPFGYRVKGDEIILPVHVQYIVRNGDNPRIDPLIVHTKNSLGFRGPEPPEFFEQQLTLIAIGGSTTEQLYISDGLTWTELLAGHLEKQFPDLWVNNAGFAGHSTYGHQVLLDDVIRQVHPDIVLYLVGANELGLVDIGPFDQAARGDLHTWKGFVRWLSLRSEVAALGLNFYRVIQARNLKYIGGNLDFNDLTEKPLTPEQIDNAMEAFRGEPLDSYRERLLQLISSTRQAGIEPVLITQPSLYGDFIDPTTGVDFGVVEVYGKQSSAEWAVLEMYNEVTREVAELSNVFLIDLAARMPKDSQYYRDMIHYTNSGSALVADILYPELCQFIATEFSAAVTPCELAP